MPIENFNDHDFCNIYMNFARADAHIAALRGSPVFSKGALFENDDPSETRDGEQAYEIIVFCMRVARELFEEEINRRSKLESLSGRVSDAIPPSIGTVVRTLRETGKVDISNPLPEDILLTQRLSMGDAAGEEAEEEGRKAGLEGLPLSSNPYDLHKDSSAIQHLRWIDGHHEGIEMRKTA